MAKPGIQQVRPLTQREFLNKMVKPTDPQYGDPNLIFSEPFKPGQPEINRAYETSFRNDPTPRKFSIGIKDIDEAVMYYFNNVIKPTVTQDGNLMAVKTIYASPERWKSIQADGFFRDSNGQIVVPLIAKIGRAHV